MILVRLHYTTTDDLRIIDFVEKNRKIGPVTGNKIWKVLADKELIKGHSWESIKDHYLKILKPALNKQNQLLHSIAGKRQREEEEEEEEEKVNPKTEEEEEEEKEDAIEEEEKKEEEETGKEGEEAKQNTQEKEDRLLEDDQSKRESNLNKIEDDIFDSQKDLQTQPQMILEADDSEDEEKLANQQRNGLHRSNTRKVQRELDLLDEEFLDVFSHPTKKADGLKQKNIKQEPEGHPAKKAKTAEPTTSNRKSIKLDAKSEKESVQHVKLIKKLAQETGQSINVVFHALIVMNGNCNAAKKYLLRFETPFEPWTPREDNLLQTGSNAKISDIVKNRGRDATKARVDFLG